MSNAANTAICRDKVSKSKMNYPYDLLMHCKNLTAVSFLRKEAGEGQKRTENVNKRFLCISCFSNTQYPYF